MNSGTPLIETPRPTKTSNEPAHSAPPADGFVRRHIGPSGKDVAAMLELIGYDSLEALVAATVPVAIRMCRPLNIGEPRGEFELLQELRQIASQNKVLRSFIGMGYYDCVTPPVIGAISWKTPAGTRNTRPTRRKSPRGDSRHCSIFKPWSAT